MEKDYFISDFHFGHKNIIGFERHQFNDIEEHDTFIMNTILNWAKVHPGATLWNLGDFGDIDKLYIIETLKYGYNIKNKLILGNHDYKGNIAEFEKVFDEVYTMPVFVHNRVVLSHEPLYPVPQGVLNIHGHTHSMKLNSEQHICASIDVAEYKPVSPKQIERAITKVPPISQKFTYEPYAHLYQLTREKKDTVYDNKTKMLDVKATRKLVAELKEKARQNNTRKWWTD